MVLLIKVEPPQDATETRHIIGLAPFDREFISNYSDIFKPLKDLTQKNTMFYWSPLGQVTFSTSKAAMTNNLILIFPDLDEPYIMFTYASKDSCSGVLTQECTRSVKDKDLKCFLLITYIS